MLGPHPIEAITESSPPIVEQPVNDNPAAEPEILMQTDPKCLGWEMNAAAPVPIGVEVLFPTQMVHSKGSATSGWRQTWIIGNYTIQLSEMREKLMNNSSALGPDRISKKPLLNWDPECKQIGRLSTM